MHDAPNLLVKSFFFVYIKFTTVEFTCGDNIDKIISFTCIRQPTMVATTHSSLSTCHSVIQSTIFSVIRMDFCCLQCADHLESMNFINEKCPYTWQSWCNAVIQKMFSSIDMLQNKNLFGLPHCMAHAIVLHCIHNRYRRWCCYHVQLTGWINIFACFDDSLQRKNWLTTRFTISICVFILWHRRLHSHCFLFEIPIKIIMYPTQFHSIQLDFIYLFIYYCWVSLYFFFFTKIDVSVYLYLCILTSSMSKCCYTYLTLYL